MSNPFRAPCARALGAVASTVALVAVAGCTQGGQVEPGAVQTSELTPKAGQTETLLARLGPDETGISFQNTLSRQNQVKFAYNGAGVAAGDVDGDGLADVFLASEEGPDKLYRNRGNLRFEDGTEKAGLTNVTDPGGFTIGVHFADTDNDGDLDLFVTNWKTKSRLFQNDGRGHFTDITDQAGVGYVGGPTTATFGDYDRDGDLDLFVPTYRPTALQYEQSSVKLKRVNGELVVPDSMKDRLSLEGGKLRELGERDLFFRNKGDGSFEEVGEQVGIVGNDWGLSSMFNDFDDDGWPDLYVTDDFWSADRFYHNNGDGSFTQVDPMQVQHTPTFSMGIDFADIDNDGLQDFFIGDMMSREHGLQMTQHGMIDEGMSMVPPQGTAPQVMRNVMQLNNGNGSFSDIAWLANVAGSEWTWTAKFADMDLDGLVDLLITNGMVRDLMDSDYTERTKELNATASREEVMDFLHQYPPLVNPNLAFRNKGDLTFEDVSKAWGFDTQTIDHGAALADFDGDGDLDLVVNNLNEQVDVFRDDSTAPRIALRLRGQSSNHYGLGAKVVLTTNQGAQTRFMTTSGGYLSSHEPVVVFGLGDAQPKELKIEWPSGHVQVIPGEGGQPLQANRAYLVAEPSGPGEITPASAKERPATQFEELAAGAGLDQPHHESQFDDFSTQMLLPRRLSTLGPGIAWSDVDRDGDDDLYLAGGAGTPGALYRNEGGGRFANVTGEMQWQPTGEGMAPLWWHTGGAPHPELLVALSSVEAKRGGGIENPVGARLKAPADEPFALSEAGWSATSDASSGPLAAADFDGDGDLDVFLGGRVLPGRWPLAAPSHLFANENGELVDVTATAAPDLESLGLATGALWTDVDGDGDPDLAVATEWGPVHLFVNDGGRLSDGTQAAGLGRDTGWWTGVVAGDFDSDGDMDLAAGNMGLNTRYTASREHPTVLYAGDVDGNNTSDLIEAEYVGDTLYPMQERGMSGMAMPFILNQFKTFTDFGKATLEEIYGDRLNSAQRFEATTLAHSLFINDGAGHFTTRPLPTMAQVSPAYGLVVADLDNDGHDDLYLAGNFRGADPMTIAYDGGISAWLRGAGDGSFEAVPVTHSGLFVPEDARGVAVADYDGDGWSDLAVAINNGPPKLFHNRGVEGMKSLRVALHGPPANPTGVGARVTVERPDGATSTREVHAGSGYLSQDSATLVFGLGDADTANLTVRWPDGTSTTRENVPAGAVVVTP